MTALPFDLVAFDPGNEEHAAFVYDSFRRSTDHWPWSEMPRGRLMDRLRRELATPGTVTKLATAQGRPGSFLGWYSARPPKTIVFAYTKYSSRRQGVATAALREMGLCRDDCCHGAMVGVVFWTAASARLTVDHNLFFDTREAYDDAG